MEKIIKVRHPRGEETELPLTAWTKFEEMYRNKGFVPIAEIEAMLKPPAEVTERVNENQIKEFINSIPPVIQAPIIEELPEAPEAKTQSESTTEIHTYPKPIKKHKMGKIKKGDSK